MVLAVFASADVYFQFMEHGLYVATFDARHAAYMKRYRQWCKREAIAQGWTTGETKWAPITTQSVGVDEHGTAIMAGGPSDPGGITHGPNGNKPRITVKIWRPIVAAMEPKKWPQDAAGVQAICRNLGYAEISGSTAHRWLKNEMPF